MTRVLGIDYGLKRIGLALGEAGLAQPLLVVKNNSATVRKIKALCQEHEVGEIVIGLPEGKIVPPVKKFAKKLSQQTGIPVSFQDETLTSQEAIAKMIEAGKGKKARQEKADAFAAALILQAYLDAHV